MKMKKTICSLMISVLCFMTAISGVSAANTYDTAKLLDATDKAKTYYKEKGLSSKNYFDDIIAYEALGGEAENDLDISQFESKITVGYLGSMAKGVIVAKLLQKDPTQLTINGTTVNLVIFAIALFLLVGILFTEISIVLPLLTVSNQE